MTTMVRRNPEKNNDVQMIEVSSNDELLSNPELLLSAGNQTLGPGHFLPNPRQHHRNHVMSATAGRLPTDPNTQPKRTTMRVMRRNSMKKINTL
jgi:hypothetical protein